MMSLFEALLPAAATNPTPRSFRDTIASRITTDSPPLVPQELFVTTMLVSKSRRIIAT